MGYARTGKTADELMTGPASEQECNTCGEVKPVSEFKRRRDAEKRCKSCIVCQAKRAPTKYVKYVHPHALWLRKEIGL